MKVLLITPKFTNDINKAFNLPTSPFGGWIDGLLFNLKNYDVNLSIAIFNKSNSESIITKIVDDITAYNISYNKNIINTFFKENSFDIIHVVGIEHSYIKDIKDYLPYDKTLINITGIQYEYAKVYLSDYNKYNNNKNLLLALNLKVQQSIIKNRGIVEQEVLKKAKYVVGRTSWDKNSVTSINPNLTYFHADEILRSNFYTSKKWSLDYCEKNTIFVSQGANPIKGTHMVLEIVKVLKEEFPNIKCYIAGEDLSIADSLFTKLNGSYASLINNLIKKYNLKENIIFTGFLNSDEIAKAMLKSNVFLMPSSIENSVNSLQEAMLLGVPCVTSLVGGVPSLIDEKSCLSYSFNDIKDASNKIAMILNNTQTATDLGYNSIIRISKLADPINNTKAMFDIYKTIYGK